MTKFIPLTQGEITLVDDDDFEELSKHEWSVNRTGTGYAVSRIHGVIRRMHRIIMDAKPGEEVDHINGFTLDNRRCNLRICSHRENCRNQRKPSNTRSKFKGVRPSNKRVRWQAYIYIDGRQKALGIFDTEEAAAKAYDNAAIQHFGEFARLNLPREV